MNLASVRVVIHFFFSDRMGGELYPSIEAYKPSPDNEREARKYNTCQMLIVT